MAVIGELAVNVVATTSGLTRNLKRASSKVKTFVQQMDGAASKSMRRFTSLVSGGALALGGLVGVTSAAGALTFGVQLAAEAEKAEVAFTTLLGSADTAKTVLKDLTDFAASTPFQVGELRGAATQLAAFGVDADDLVPTLRALGDVSAGINQPIGEIADVYGKARVQGRLFMEDINQLTGRGIPIIGELAKQFGVAESEVRNLVSSGQVNFSNLRNAFVDLSSEGGKFAGLMDAQSKTLAGSWSTLKDNIQLSLKDIGESIIEGFDLTTVIGNLTDFVKTHKTDFVDRVTAGLVFLSDAVIAFGDTWNFLKGVFLKFRSVFNRVLSGILRVSQEFAKIWDAIAKTIFGANLGLSDFVKNFRAGLDRSANEDAKAASKAFDDAFKLKNNPVQKLIDELTKTRAEPAANGKTLTKVTSVEGPVRAFLEGAAKGIADSLKKQNKAAREKKKAESEVFNTSVMRGSSEAFRIQTGRDKPELKVAKESLVELKEIKDAIKGGARGAGAAVARGIDSVFEFNPLAALGFEGE